MAQSRALRLLLPKRLRSAVDARSRLRAASRARMRIAITQPYVPAYRVALWERVVRELDANGVECRVFWGGTRRNVAMIMRRDDATTPEWSQRVRTLQVRWSRGHPPLEFRFLPSGWRRPTALLTEMQASNGNAWLARLLHRTYVTMGHGMSDLTTQSRLADALETTLNRSAEHVLVYTPAGRTAMSEMFALDPRRVTSFDNATDVDRLRHAAESVTPEQLDAFRARHGIPAHRRIALIVSAIEPYKRIDLVAEAARIVFSIDDDWHLVVGGEGSDRQVLEDLASETGRVTLLGHVEPEDYAPAARLATLILNPGRIGLVAVDALALGLPLVTTDTAKHAPEFSYLRHGRDVVIAHGTPEGLAAAWHDFRPLDAGGEKPLELSADRSGRIIARVLLEAVRSAGHRAGGSTARA